MTTYPGDEFQLRPAITRVRARQWADGTDPEELARWCDGWTYTGTQHGHTRPEPFVLHTCLNLNTAPGSKGHADPGDWIVRVSERDDEEGWGTYEVLSPAEFAVKYEPAAGS
jgi:hypothetical protein